MLQLITRQAANESPQLVGDIAQAAGISPLTALVLLRRGLDTPEMAAAFLGEGQLHDPLLLDDMAASVALIRRTMEAKLPITVYGDYDCDGTCASAILHQAFLQQGVAVEVYLPSRAEGYGLNEGAMRTIAERGGLLITVDCGITNLKEVALAKALGLEVIVTDHHEPLDTLPDCLCINPKRSEHYPCGALCGAGVALKLVQALFGREAADALMDYAAVATVADIVPLIEENRTIVQRGLDLMHRTPRASLLALTLISGFGNKPVTAGQIAFGLAPRINAAGRMAHARLAFDLLIDDQQQSATFKAQQLEELNRQRQAQEQDILDQALHSLAATLGAKRAAVAVGQGWHQGVIGIVASRLVETLHRPAAVITVRDDGQCVGSMRGIGGVSVFDALCACAEHLSRYGGHQMAGGFSLELNKLDAFEAALQRFFDGYPAQQFERVVQCDLALDPIEITPTLARDFERLAPFGVGNATPTVMIQNARLLSRQNLGRTDDHQRLEMEKDGTRLSALLFRAKQHDIPRTNSLCDFVGTLEMDDYQGREQTKYILREMRLCPDTITGAARSASGVFGYAYCKTMEAPPLTRATMEDVRVYAADHPYGLLAVVRTPAACEGAIGAMAQWPPALVPEPNLFSVKRALQQKNTLLLSPLEAALPPFVKTVLLDTEAEEAAFRKSLRLDHASMAAIYQALKASGGRPMEFSARCAQIGESLQRDAAFVGAGLAVFEQLELIRLQGLTIELIQTEQKRDLLHSPIYQALSTQKGGSE